MTTTHLTMGIVCLLGLGKCPWDWSPDDWPPEDWPPGDSDGAGDPDLEIAEACTWDTNNLSFPIQVWTGAAAYGEIAFDGNCDLIVGGGEELPYVDALYRVDSDDGSVSVVVEIEQLDPASLYIPAITHRAIDNRIYFVDGLADVPYDLLYAVDDQNVVHEILELEERVHSLTVAPDDFGPYGGQLVAASYSPLQLITIDVDNLVVTPRFDLDPQPTAVTFGPDGTLYVAEHAADRISTVTADGVITPLVTDLTDPRGLALSPDGTKMFVAHRPGGVGRIDQISLADLTLTPGMAP